MSKVTEEGLKALVKKATYHRFPDTTVTVCCITLTNGYNLIGQSACVVPANFEEAIGKQLAFENAFAQLWPLEGYLLNHKING